MTRLPWIPATGAAAVVVSAAAMALAQVQRVDPSELVRGERERQAVVRAMRQRRSNLANQLRPFYRYELMHARTACGLSQDELRKIRPEADTAYQEAIARLEAAGADVRPSPGDSGPDYHEAIRDAVLSVMDRHVAPERGAALRADIRSRQAGRKEAGVDMFVAVLDRELLFTEPQRRQIAESVAAQWDDRWCDALEAATGGRVVIPDIPDRLVEPHLSAAQKETWSRLSRLPGRLWGVTIDHGGDPAMERELGARLQPRQVPVAPRPVVRQPPIAVVPDRLRPVVRQPAIAVAPQQFQVVVRQPAVVFDPARVQPRGGDEDDADDDANQAMLARQREREALLKRRLALLRQQTFDRYVYGTQQTEADARLRLETELARRVDNLGRAGGLTDVQRKKLLVAGQGDLKRFFDRVAEARRGLEAIENQRALVLETARVCKPLSQERLALEAAEGPIFTKALPRALTEAQRAAMEKDARDRRVFRHRAAVRWTAMLLTRSLGLVDDQRRRLESLLLKETRPPLKFDSFDYWIVMYEASRIPEARIRPIFDNVQWWVLTQELNAARQWERHLDRGGFLPKEILDSHQDAVLPAIRLREAPDANIRP